MPGRRLDQVTVDAFLAYRLWRRSARRSTHGPRRPISDASINRDLSFAKMVLNHAVVEGLLATNPLAGMRRLKEMRKGRRVMTKAEVAKLLLVADEDFRPFLMASIYTGCRPCELRALRWRDVLFEPAKLRIDRKKVKLGDVIDLHPALADELQHFRTRQREAGYDVRAEDYVFQSPHGTPWVNMRRAWRRALKAAGLEGSGLTPYSTRHSLACQYLTCGGNVIDLASQLGRSDVKTTMIYASMVDERRRAGSWRSTGGRPPRRRPVSGARNLPQR